MNAPVSGFLQREMSRMPRATTLIPSFDRHKAEIDVEGRLIFGEAGIGNAVARMVEIHSRNTEI